MAKANPNRVHEPMTGRVLTYALTTALVGILSWAFGDIVQTVRTEWPSLVFWAVLVIVVNLWPLNLGEITLTLDMPLLLSIGILFPPPVAAVVALAAAVDLREIIGGVPATRAVFNRVQVSYCVLAASGAFHAVVRGTEFWGLGLLGTLCAVGAFHLVNMGLVAAYTWLRLGAWNRFTVGAVGQFAVTYGGYGLLAFVLAQLFADIGAWSVVTFVLPIAVARQAFARTQHLVSVTKALRDRERLLEVLFDRMSDERRDERKRIAAELHDDVLQSLIRIGQLGDFLAKGIRSGQGSIDAREVSAVARGTVLQLREIVGGLRSSPLGPGGLGSTLEKLARDLQLDWRGNISVEAEPVGDLSSETQLVLYHVAREALLNALKHASAERVALQLRRGSDGISLTIQDDGRGFNPREVDSAAHFGLGLMRERVHRAGGRFELESEREGGTSVSALIPVPEGATTPSRP